MIESLVHVHMYMYMCIQLDVGCVLYLLIVYLIISWGEWSRILSTGRFKKRQLSPADIENIARTMVCGYISFESVSSTHSNETMRN